MCSSVNPALSTPSKLVRILIVPDHDHLTSATPMEPGWYQWLSQSLSHYQVETLRDFPDPYASNTKRWESVWLGHLRRSLGFVLREDDTPGSPQPPLSSSSSYLVGHGTGADAVLRLMETEAAEFVSGVILLGPCDEYFAGERHGRRFHWTQILRNAQGRLAHMYTSNDSRVSLEEAGEIARFVGDSTMCSTDLGRFRNITQFPQVRDKLVEWISHDHH